MRPSKAIFLLLITVNAVALSALAGDKFVDHLEEFYTEAKGGYEIAFQEDVLLLKSPSAHSWYNMAWGKTPDPGELSSFYDRTFTYYYPQDQVNLGSDLTQVRTIDLDSYQASQIDSGAASIVFIDKKSDDMRRWVELCARNFGKDADVIWKNVTPLIKSDKFGFFLALIEEVPVGTAMIFLGEETAGLHMLSVDSHYRKQGIATQLMKARLNLAKEKGLSWATLVAWSHNQKICDGLGFSKIFYKEVSLPFTD